MQRRGSGMTGHMERPVQPLHSGIIRKLSALNWPTALMVVVLGMLLSKFVLASPMYFIVAGSIAFVLGLILIRNLQLAMYVYLFFAALAFGESPGVASPHSGYKAGLMPSQVFLAFVVFLWIGRAIFLDGFRLVKSELNLPLAALGVVALASLIANNVLQGTRELLFHQLVITQVAEVGLLGFSICAFFLAANTLKDRKWIGRVFFPILLLGLYFAAHRIFHFSVPIIWGSLLLAAAIAFVYARLLFARLDRPRIVVFSVLLAVMLYAAYNNLSWVSGWVAATGAILMVSYYRSKLLAVLLIGIILVGFFVYPGVYHDVHRESEEGGDFDRFIIWYDAFKMFMAVNPTLGVGPGNYHPYVYYHSTQWFGGHTYTTAHSNYVQMASELGLVGLAVFLWVIISAIRTGSKAARRSPPELRWLGIAASSIFVGIALASVFGDYLFPSRGNNGIVNFGTTVYSWLIMGAAVAAGNLAIESKSEGEGASEADQ